MKKKVNVEEFFKVYSTRIIANKHDMILKQFDYHDLMDFAEEFAEVSNGKGFAEKEIVSFGNYLLSQERENRIHHKENLSVVHDSDIRNWQEEHKK